MTTILKIHVLGRVRIVVIGVSYGDGFKGFLRDF